MKILDGYGTEVAIPSIASPMDTSYVVKSRETERFENEIHDHKEELRSSNESLTELHGSGRNESYGEREEEARATRILVQALSAIRLSVYTQRTIPANEKKWKVIHAHSPDG